MTAALQQSSAGEPKRKGEIMAIIFAIRVFSLCLAVAGILYRTATFEHNDGWEAKYRKLTVQFYFLSAAYGAMAISFFPFK